jgi:hypothetical protein
MDQDSDGKDGTQAGDRAFAIIGEGSDVLRS